MGVECRENGYEAYPVLFVHCLRQCSPNLPQCHTDSDTGILSRLGLVLLPTRSWLCHLCYERSRSLSINGAQSPRRSQGRRLVQHVCHWNHNHYKREPDRLLQSIRDRWEECGHRPALGSSWPVDRWTKWTRRFIGAQL